MAKKQFIQSNFENATFGRFGIRVLGVGTSVSGETFTAFQALEETTINADLAILENDGGGDETITALVIPAGVVIYGLFTEIEVVSGGGIAYLG